jgi:DNA-binding response OmpR family regulator
MAEISLQGCRILAVEDEYMLADDLRAELENAGAIVIGPAATVQSAMALVRDEARIDGAILDVNLGGEMVYPVADLLMERGVPIAFTTGYDASAIPARFRDIPRCEKPISMAKVVQGLGRRRALPDD